MNASVKIFANVLLAAAFISATAANAGSTSSVGTSLGNTTVEQSGGVVKAKVIGAAAATIYESLSAAQTSGPFATGACVPNRPCDPPTFWGRRGSGVTCSKVTHSVSGRIDYSCELTIAADGAVTAD